MKGSLKTAKYLFEYVWKRDKLLLFGLFIEQLISAIMPIVTILFPKFIIDELMNKQRISYLVVYIASFAVLTFGINFLSKYMWMINFVRIEGNLRFKFDGEIGQQVANLEYKFLEMPDVLDLKEKAKNSMYHDTPYSQFAGALISLFKIIAQGIVLLTISGIIVTLNPILILLLSIIFFVNFSMSKWSNKKNYNISVEKTPFKRKSDYFKNIMEDFSFGKEIRLNALTSFFTNKFISNRNIENELNKKTYINNFKVSVVVAMTSFIQMVVVYGYLIWQVLYRAMTIGNFTMYFSAISQFTQAVSGTVDSILNLNKVGYTLVDLEKFMNLEKVMDTAVTAKIPVNEFVFEFVDVSFCYPNSEVVVLKNINLKIDFLEHFSIVGFNGAGKTTFIKLLTRLYKPTSGKILLNGIDINEFDFYEYINMFSIVFQDFKLFCFTLSENITIGRENLDKTLDEVIENSGLTEKISGLTNGIDTYIYKVFDENGIEPSGGEGQKIAIARAIYKNAPVVILDEPTAALDPLAEYEIYHSFDKIAENKTAIYISHRLSSTQFSDKVVLFENGQIVEYGNHDTLMEQGGLYADMFSKQSQYYI